MRLGEYASAGRVATTAGIVDAFIYLGSGLSGAATGELAQRMGWPYLFALWAATCLSGAVLIAFSARREYARKL